jgi:DNA-binding IclR family transcriptional regulator
MAHRDGVAAVDRALAVLEAFDGAGPVLSLSELARHTGQVKSTVFRVAASLERGDFLRRGEDGRYRLGPALIRLGARYQAAFELGDVVVPVLARLSQTTGESASFYVREEDRRVCLYRVNSRQHQLLHLVQVGTQFPHDTGASGRVIVAFTEPAAPDPEGVRERLVAVSISDRTISETAAVAAPVFGSAGVFLGALSLAGPATRFDEAALPRLERAVLAAAAGLGATLGCPGGTYRRALAGLGLVDTAAAERVPGRGSDRLDAD